MTAQPFPFTLANLPGGNNPVSDIDANFGVCMRGPSVTVQGNVGYWDNTSGTSYGAGYPTLPAFGTIAKVVGVDGANKLPPVDASNLTNIPAGLIYNYIGGLTLSNDSGTPNTILDIAAGVCADSTNATMISLGAFTKSTAGSWTAGTGNNGMGVGLTIANTTWYHVFAIINSNVTDVYFDTSATGANKPVGTTFFRRIGSFRTDSSAHIIAFTQVGSLFLWAVEINDVAGASQSTPSTITLTVPTGVIVNALLNAANNVNGDTRWLLYSGNLSNITFATGHTNGQGYGATGNGGSGQYEIQTDTSARIKFVALGTINPFYVWTSGWTDYRGFV